MKLYLGNPSGLVCVRTVEGRCLPRLGDTDDWRELAPRLDLANHSPTGFAWGYGGSGPAQLALALAADHLGNDEHALLVHQALKFSLVAHLPLRQPWALSDTVLAITIGSLQRLNLEVPA